MDTKEDSKKKKPKKKSPKKKKTNMDESFVVFF